MTGFPVSQKKTLKELVLTEGQSIQYYGFNIGTLNAGALSTGFGVGFFPNRAVYIDTVVVSSNVPIYADLVISGQSSTLSLSANTSITVPINSIYRPFETVNNNFLIIKKLRNADGTDATAPTNSH